MPETAIDVVAKPPRNWKRKLASPPPADPDMQTAEEFGAWARIGRSQVFVEIRAGRLVPTYVGKRLLITRASREAWRDALPNKRESKV